MSALSPRLSLGFSALGHAFAHMFQPIFYVAALTMVTDLHLPYAHVLELIVVGNLLLGFGAVPAGWLADRWSAVGMMAVFFLGSGVAAILTGLARTPGEISAALALLGLFLSIYHPVGIPWLVRNAVKRGTALGINGVFGGVGPALGALTATAMIWVSGWRLAFVVPGVLALATGGYFLWLIQRGVIVEAHEDRKPEPVPGKNDMVRVFLVLSVTMLCSGLIYQTAQAALPKVFSERLGGVFGGAVGAGGMVTVVYFIAGLMQVAAGWLADRFPLKSVYATAALLEVPALFLAAQLSGLALAVAATAVVAFNVGSQPAENALLARYTPARWRGVFFGLKFVLTFGVSGLGAQMAAWFYHANPGGASQWLLMTLGGLAVVMAIGARALPRDKALHMEASPAPAK